LLRAQHFSASPRSRIAPCSALGPPHRAWIAPCPVAVQSVDASSSSTFRLTFDLRHRSTRQLRLRNPTSGFRQLLRVLRLSLRSTFNFRRRPILRLTLRTHPPTLAGCCIFPPSLPGQPWACAADWPSSLAFQSNLRLSSMSHLPADPSSRPSACAADQLSGPAFGTLLPTLTGCCALWLRLPINLRLSPPANLPVLPWSPTSRSRRLPRPSSPPSDQPSAFASDRPSNLAFEPGFRLSSAVVAFRLRFAIDLRPSPSINPSASPSNST